MLGLLVSGVGVVLGCRTPLVETRLGADDPRPAGLLAALAESAERRPAMRARARVEVHAPDLQFRRPQRLAVARPERLRVEVVGLFGQVAALLVARDSRYQFYEAGRAELQEGALTPSLLWQLARVDLAPGDAVDLLLGVPRPDLGRDLSRAWLRADGRLGFAAVDVQGRVREQYVFDPKGRLAEMEQLEAGGARSWRARFSDYRTVPRIGGGEEEFAFRVRLDFPRVEGRANLEFQHVELVAELPEELFRLALPGSEAR